MAEQISHRMPESIRRVAKGEYEVRGTQLRIVQGDAAKWVIEGHGEDLGAFGSRGAALGKLQELGLVPAVQAKATEQPEAAKGEEQPKRRPRTRATARYRCTRPQPVRTGPRSAVT